MLLKYPSSAFLVPFHDLNRVLLPLVGLPAIETAKAAAVDLPVLEFPINENMVPANSTSCLVFRNAVTNEEAANTTASSSSKFPLTCFKYISHQPLKVPFGCKS
ncbi:putative uncharacterized protein [Staphylococcus equorum subsp. equorum Mu2]|nr:putative uncharacterized protein [Staphylococcus equorum subsp. equorum Mu2]